MVDILISSSNNSNQVSHQAQQEEKQKGMEVELSDSRLCSAVKAEEDHLHPEPEMGEGTLEQSHHQCIHCWARGP